MKKKIKALRKRRTRDHIIADLSTNFVEKFALENGYSVERIEKDYGYDLNVYTYSTKGEIENGTIFLQLKATESIRKLKNTNEISFTIEKKDLNTWYFEPYPVIVIVYDAYNKIGYWVYLQQTLRRHPKFNLTKVKKEYNLRIPISNKINKSSFLKFNEFKAKTLKQINNVISYE